jgi:hypothetical protein
MEGKKGFVGPACGKKKTRGVEVWLHSFLTSTPDGVEWSPSRPSRFSHGKERRSSLSKRLGGYHIPSGRCWTRKTYPAPGGEKKTEEKHKRPKTFGITRAVICTLVCSVQQVRSTLGRSLTSLSVAKKKKGDLLFRVIS